jgi:hypothetical protein
MVARPLRWQVPWIAVAAIVGAMSWVGTAAACSDRAMPERRSSCCASSERDGCNCRATDPVVSLDDSAEGPTARSASTPLGHRSATSCGCRVERPTAPASPSQSRPSDDGRPDRIRAETSCFTSLAGDLPNAMTHSRLAAAPDVPSGAPVYLRLLHLLI